MFELLSFPLWLVYALVDDLLTLPLRPLILLHYFIPTSYVDHVLQYNGISAHLILCFALFLILVSLHQLFNLDSRALLHTVAALYFCDALFQFYLAFANDEILKVSPFLSLTLIPCLWLQNTRFRLFFGLARFQSCNLSDIICLYWPCVFIVSIQLYCAAFLLFSVLRRTCGGGICSRPSITSSSR